jgi:hypothetical protein
MFTPGWSHTVVTLKLSRSYLPTLISAESRALQTTVRRDLEPSRFVFLGVLLTSRVIDERLKPP